MYQLDTAIILLASLLFIGGYTLYSFLRKKPKELKKQPVGWTALESVLVAVGIYFAGQLLASVLIGVYGSAMGQTEAQLSGAVEASTSWQFSYLLLASAVSGGLVHLYLRRRQTTWQAIGWTKFKLSYLGYAAAGFVVYFLVFAAAVGSLIEKFLPQIDLEQRQELGFATDLTGPELLLVFVSLVILPPLIEEIISRGFMFSGLRQRMRFLPAALIVSVVFGFAHLQLGSGNAPLWVAAIDTFVLSMVMVYLREKTGSLWPGIIIHFMKNGLAFTFLFVFKDLI